jgi:hypothetical protein
MSEMERAEIITPEITPASELVCSNLENSNGRQVNTAASRFQRTVESLANALLAAKAL